MRLFVSSFRLGKHPEALVALTGQGKRALVVINACDFLTGDDRDAKYQQERQALHLLGYEVEELDLREYFNRDNHTSLRDRLLSCDLLWVRGGNTFILQRAFAASGMSKALAPLLAEDRFVYGGYSAGVAVLTPTLRGLELVDDPALVPVGYPAEFDWAALGVLPYALAPHYRSDHPESALVDKLVEHFIATKLPFVALRDGEVIVRQEDRTDVLPN